MMHALKLALGAVCMACLGASPSQAGIVNGLQLCQNSNIQRTVIKVVGAWAGQYSFTKVLIGGDWPEATLAHPLLSEEHPDYVVCQASYKLWKQPTSMANLAGYTVGIPRLNYRLTPDGANYRITLEDFPDGLADTPTEMNKLIDRFTINERPYADVVKANADRLNGRR